MAITIWTTHETAPFSGRWHAVGSTMFGDTITDSKTFDNRKQADLRCDVLNRKEESK